MLGRVSDSLRLQGLKLTYKISVILREAILMNNQLVISCQGISKIKDKM
jgi:hypothetical protein